MVAKFQDYLNAFLCSLALCAGLEIPALELIYRAQEIAFALSEHWRVVSEAQEPAIKCDSKLEETENEEKNSQVQVPLEQALKHRLKKVSEGEQLPTRYLLEAVPFYEGLKSKVEGQETNHQDKVLKSCQQRMLNVARVLAMLYPVLKEAGAEYDTAMQRLFHYILETESQLAREWTRGSLPGATAQVSTGVFKQKGLMRDRWPLNQAGMSCVGRAWAPLTLYFRNPAGNKSFRFRGTSKGLGKSPSSWPSWRDHSLQRSQAGFGRAFRTCKGLSKWPATCPRYGSKWGRISGYDSRYLHGAVSKWFHTTSPSSFSTAENLPWRGVLGTDPPTFAASGVFPLVEEACPTWSGSVDHAGSATILSTSCPPVQEP